MPDIYDELRWRELLHQCTDPVNLQALLNERPRTVYVGFDPTADSMHVGNLVAVMMLRRFQQAGHRPIALVGGATGMIGDPSGKSEERNLLNVEVLRHNVACLEKQLRRFLAFDGVPNAAQMANNFDWMGRFGYIEFLRDIGKHFPVNVMLAKDSVKSRLERTDSGLSYTEFSYMLLQAYDFVHLHDQFGCELQAGGSDQWGNITAGIDLARRMRGVQLQGVTCPLLTKSDGTRWAKPSRGRYGFLPSEPVPTRSTSTGSIRRMPTWASACATSAISARPRSSKSRINTLPTPASESHKNSLPPTLRGWSTAMKLLPRCCEQPK